MLVVLCLIVAVVKYIVNKVLNAVAQSRSYCRIHWIILCPKET